MITRFRTLQTLTFTMLITAWLAGCSSTAKSDDEAFKQFNAKQLFEKSEIAMGEGEYKTAITFFEALDSRYPFSPYSQQAQLDMIYAYYKYGDKPSAAAAADRYIQMYPSSQHVDYAYYMRGIANYEQDHGFLQRYFPIDDAQRDLGTAFQAYQDFNALIQYYPNSQYARDARKRMVHLRELLARHELQVAEYNYKRAAYVASVNRANRVVQYYSQTASVHDALVVLVKANRKLGLDKTANDALRVLQLNYPKSPQLAELGSQQSSAPQEKSDHSTQTASNQTPAWKRFFQHIF